MTVLRKALSISLYSAAAGATLTPVSFAVAQTTGAIAAPGTSTPTLGRPPLEFLACPHPHNIKR